MSFTWADLVQAAHIQVPIQRSKIDCEICDALFFFNHLEEVELLKVLAEEKPGGALLRHRARAADVQVPQEAAVLTDLRVVVI